jgi:hypothetical protein
LHAPGGPVAILCGGMTRRFEIGPLLIALAAVALVVALFLRWYGADNAWHAFELTDIVLAGLALACLVIAGSLAVAELRGLDQRPLPWLVGAVLLIVAAELLSPPPTVAVTRLGTGAWMALAAACLMLVGAVLTVARVSFAVAVEGRDLRRRVSAVDHRPPPTETGESAEGDSMPSSAAPNSRAATPGPAPRARSSEPLLGRHKQPEPTEEA